MLTECTFLMQRDAVKVYYNCFVLASETVLSSTHGLPHSATANSEASCRKDSRKQVQYQYQWVLAILFVSVSLKVYKHAYSLLHYSRELVLRWHVLVENIMLITTPNIKIATTSLHVVIAYIRVCMPLFRPRRSSFNLSMTVTTTLGETAVMTRLEYNHVIHFSTNIPRKYLPQSYPPHPGHGQCKIGQHSYNGNLHYCRNECQSKNHKPQPPKCTAIKAEAS